MGAEHSVVRDGIGATRPCAGREGGEGPNTTSLVSRAGGPSAAPRDDGVAPRTKGAPPPEMDQIRGAPRSAATVINTPVISPRPPPRDPGPRRRGAFVWGAADEASSVSTRSLGRLMAPR